MVFGTFDIVHEGHKHFFKQARQLASKSQTPFLIVSIARDKNVAKIKSLQPRHSEKQRLAVVAKTEGVDKAVLGGVNNYINHIVKENPDVIALGYDQVAYVGSLQADLKAAGLHTKIVRLKAHKPHLYKTSIIKPRK